ncbi:MAG: hypothetical protein R2704_01580 [Microthrixaceae bacterium]
MGFLLGTARQDEQAPVEAAEVATTAPSVPVEPIEPMPPVDDMTLYRYCFLERKMIIAAWDAAYIWNETSASADLRTWEDYLDSSNLLFFGVPTTAGAPRLPPGLQDVSDLECPDIYASELRDG